MSNPVFSLDESKLVWCGKRYVFVPHDIPRCGGLCAFGQIPIDNRGMIACFLADMRGRHTRCSFRRKRKDGVTGYWEETEDGHV